LTLVVPRPARLSKTGCLRLHGAVDCRPFQPFTGKIGVNWTHDVQPHDVQPHDVQPHDVQPHDVQPHDVQPHDVQPQ
jgi:hypothetical protein